MSDDVAADSIDVAQPPVQDAEARAAVAVPVAGSQATARWPMPGSIIASIATVARQRLSRSTGTVCAALRSPSTTTCSDVMSRPGLGCSPSAAPRRPDRRRRTCARRPGRTRRALIVVAGVAVIEAIQHHEIPDLVAPVGGLQWRPGRLGGGRDQRRQGEQQGAEPERGNAPRGSTVAEGGGSPRPTFHPDYALMALI